MKRILLSNIISGLSLFTLIVFGTQYLIFKNTEPYQNLLIFVENNPVKYGEELDFVLMGEKVLECSVNGVYAVATNRNGEEVVLDEINQPYFRNTPVGENSTNSWSMPPTESLTPGTWQVTIFGDWNCKHWIFSHTDLRYYDNILLIVEE